MFNGPSPPLLENSPAREAHPVKSLSLSCACPVPLADCDTSAPCPRQTEPPSPPRSRPHVRPPFRSTLSPPLPSRAKQNSFLHLELLIHHLAPWRPLLLVPPLHHRQATAPSGRATTEAVVHSCLLHLHGCCCTQAYVHHNSRPMRIDAVHPYGCLSDGRPPPTTSTSRVATARSAPTPRSFPTRESAALPPGNATTNGSPLPKHTTMEDHTLVSFWTRCAPNRIPLAVLSL
jgi:hypothetical protein